MTPEEIIEIMNKPLSSERVGYYRVIFKMSTGEDFKGCLCGNGAQRLYQACKAYANALNNNNKKK